VTTTIFLAAGNIARCVLSPKAIDLFFENLADQKRVWPIAKPLYFA